MTQCQRQGTKRLFEPTPPLLVLPLLVGEGGAKRRVRVNRVFRCRQSPQNVQTLETGKNACLLEFKRINGPCPSKQTFRSTKDGNVNEASVSLQAGNEPRLPRIWR